MTEEKRVLGKILFWDEQLSSDNTVACGTCHRPGVSGADNRVGLHPGRDGKLGTNDDVVGSPGIRRLDERGLPLHYATYGHERQVTDRRAPSYFASLWADSQFWDGRAPAEFRDPVTNAVLIRHGGSLESQSLVPLMNAVEMAKSGREWSELTAKLQQAVPLALADHLPTDMRDAVERHPSYPELFEQAFGDPTISAARIAFAIASYERTLVADQTPWDLYDAADAAQPPPAWRTGFTWFETHNCHECHTPPLFTNNAFASIGLGRDFHGRGRAAVTGRKEDEGDMKVPSLRNVGLRSHFMHTGRLTTLPEVFDLYADPKEPFDTLPSGEPYATTMTDGARTAIEQFLRTALTDPRVAAEAFPFDRPRLRSERHQDDTTPPEPPLELRATARGNSMDLHWTAAKDDTGVVDYVLMRNGAVVALPTRTEYVDGPVRAGWIYRYQLVARDAAGNASAIASATVWPLKTMFVIAVLVAGGAGVLIRLTVLRRSGART